MMINELSHRGDETMNAHSWNEWLTLAANVGVVIGLGMLIFELKYAADLAEVGAYQTRMTEISETAKAIALSEDLADIHERLWNDGYESLTPVEQRRVRAWEVGVTMRMQAQYYQYERGFLEESALRAMIGAAAASLPLWEKLDLDIENAEFLAAVKAKEPMRPRPM
jgi:hypothetical protein